MADTENAAAGGQSGGDPVRIGLNTKFITTPPGVMMLINMLFLFLGWCIMAGWRDATHLYTLHKYDGRSSFYLATTVIPWLVFILFFIMLLFNVNQKLTFINFPITIFINCCLWALLLFISSTMTASRARKYYCPDYKCGHLEAAAAFGYLAVIGMGIQAFLHFREWKTLS